jgi:hypothetical protein
MMLSLKRMFSVAVIAGKAANCPRAKLEENNTRKGFFELEQFNSVLRHLPVDLKPMAETSYIIGWRIVSEILTRQRHHVDLKVDGFGWIQANQE